MTRIQWHHSWSNGRATSLGQGSWDDPSSRRSWASPTNRWPLPMESWADRAKYERFLTRRPHTFFHPPGPGWCCLRHLVPWLCACPKWLCRAYVPRKEQHCQTGLRQLGWWPLARCDRGTPECRTFLLEVLIAWREGGLRRDWCKVNCDFGKKKPGSDVNLLTQDILLRYPCLHENISRQCYIGELLLPQLGVTFHDDSRVGKAPPAEDIDEHTHELFRQISGRETGWAQTEKDGAGEWAKERVDVLKWAKDKHPPHTFVQWENLLFFNVHLELLIVVVLRNTSGNGFANSLKCSPPMYFVFGANSLGLAVKKLTLAKWRSIFWSSEAVSAGGTTSPGDKRVAKKVALWTDWLTDWLIVVQPEK